MLFKLKDYDKLVDELQELKQHLDDAVIYTEHLEVSLRETKKDLEEEKNKNIKLKEKINYIDLPKHSFADLEKKLMLADIYTLQIIVDYLSLDSYELIKNIASRIDKNNIDNYIAYRDWALWRNEELKKVLLKYISKKDTYIDRIDLEEKKKNTTQDKIII